MTYSTIPCDEGLASFLIRETKEMKARRIGREAKEASIREWLAQNGVQVSSNNDEQPIEINSQVC